MTPRRSELEQEPEHVRERLGDAPRGPQAQRLAPPADRTPPQNVELEMCVLGAIMLEPKDAWQIAAERLTPSDFYLEGNAVIFETMAELHQRGLPPDLNSVLDELKAHGLLDAVGGSGVLLGMLNSVPTAANLEQHATKVAEKARLRRLQRVGTELVDECFRQQRSSGEIAAAVGNALTRIADTGQGGEAQGIGELLDERMPVIAERIAEADALRAAGKRIGSVARGGIASSISELDRLTGGFNFGESWFIGAETSMGKTALGLSMIIDMACYQGLPCGVLTLEMSTARLTARLLSMRSFSSGYGVGGWVMTKAMRTGDLAAEQKKALAFAEASLRQAPLAMDYGAGLTIGEVTARLRRLHQRHGCRVLMTDHLHKVVTRSGDPASAGDYGAWAGALCDLAVGLGVLMLIPCQLNRPGEKTSHQKPTLYRILGAEAIAQAADGVLLLFRKNYYDRYETPLGSGEPTEIIVAKNRDGELRTVPSLFLPPVVLFTNAQGGAG